MNNVKLFAQRLDTSAEDFLPKTGDATLIEIFQYIYAILGVIAVLMSVYSGIQMILSSGNSEKVATARRTLIYSIVGLAIIISAAAVTAFVAGRFF
jgi:heme O synthase-like polyprenyltransferase